MQRCRRRKSILYSNQIKKAKPVIAKAEASPPPRATWLERFDALLVPGQSQIQGYFKK
jgi:hypothetical protein